MAKIMVEPRDAGHTGKSLIRNKEIFLSLFLVLESPFLFLPDPSRKCWEREDRYEGVEHHVQEEQQGTRKVSPQPTYFDR